MPSSRAPSQTLHLQRLRDHPDPILTAGREASCPSCGSKYDTSGRRFATPLGKQFSQASKTATSTPKTVNRYATGGTKNYTVSGNVTVMEPKALDTIATMAGRRGISYRDAARVLGLSKSTIIRRQAEGWNLNELMDLADHYGVNRANLMAQLGHIDAADTYTVVGDDDLPVFRTVRGGMWSTPYACREIRQYSTAHGRPTRWHDLRHFYASQLIDAGNEIEQVSKLMGHASVAITQEIYIHLMPHDDEKARGAFDGIF